MKKKFILFLVVINSITLTSLQSVMAQSWVITGNNNTTALSKLGTTNFIPLNLVTNNATRVRITEIGQVGIGTTAPVNILTVQSGGSTPAGSWLNGLNNPIFDGFAQGVSSEFVLSTADNTDPDHRSLIQGRRSRGTLAAPTAVLNNDYLASVLASGYDGGTFQNPALVSFFVDGVPSAGHVPARISLVTGTNFTDRVERLKVGSTGNFTFNNNQMFISASTGRVGIGTTNPNRLLHVFNGSAGIVTPNANSPFVVENSTNNYIDVLAPTAAERGILFGEPGDAQDGGIVYVGATNAMQFRTNGNATRMTLSSTGNLGIGTTTPDVKLQVEGGTDAGPAGGGFIVSGSSTAANVAIDNNEIMARSNGAISNLFLNNNGGDLIINGTNGAGNLGFGTSSPAVDAHIVHGVGSGSTNGLRLQNEGANAENWTFYVQNSNGNLELYENGVFRGSFNDATGTYTASDKRLKKDFESTGNILPKLMKLEVLKYNLINGRPRKYKQYGLIAQDVEKIFPEFVDHSNLDNGTDRYSMNYTNFGVIAIKAIQEQQAAIEAKDQQITELSNQIDKLQNILISKGIVTSADLNNNATAASLSKASLGQSIPNPTNGITTLSYYLPNDVKKASIIISSVNGAVLRSYPISQMGSGQLSLDSKDLAAGVYIYTLTVNGNKFDSKKMVVLK